jgi:hypothetical protein
LLWALSWDCCHDLRADGSAQPFLAVSQTQIATFSLKRRILKEGHGFSRAEKSIVESGFSR